MSEQVHVGTFDKADEVRSFNNGHLEIVRIGDREIGRTHFEPGWRWSNDVKPIAQTELCQVHHVGYLAQGQMGVQMADGTELELTPGSVSDIPPGHDAWVIGDETCVMVDWGGPGNYAKPTSG
jgi:hypothetical protein